MILIPIYDIAQNYSKGSLQVSAVRQYSIMTENNVSFPYFYPLMIAVADWFLGFDIYTGSLINIAVFLFTAYYVYKISIKLTGSSFPGLIAIAMLSVSQNYLEEVLAARSIPLAILCTCIVLNKLICLPQLSKKELLILGIAAGASAVIRFDGIVVTFFTIFIVVVALFLKKIGLREFILFLIGVLIPVMPWLLYSLLLFGKIWVSDNGGNTFSVSVSNPLVF